MDREVLTSEVDDVFIRGGGTSSTLPGFGAVWDGAVLGSIKQCFTALPNSTRLS